MGVWVRERVRESEREREREKEREKGIRREQCPNELQKALIINK